MKLGELIERVARVMQTDVDVVKRAARRIRESGLMTTGARGVNAPDMTPLDAARLLIAFLADPAPGTASDGLVKRYGGLPNPYRDVDTPPALSFESLRKARPATFEAGLAMLIEVYALDRDTQAFRDASTRYRDHTQPPECECVLSIDPQPEAVISLHARHDSGWRYTFSGPLLSPKAALETDPRVAPVVQRSAEIRAGGITFIAEGFRS